MKRILYNILIQYIMLTQNRGKFHTFFMICGFFRSVRAAMPAHRRQSPGKERAAMTEKFVILLNGPSAAGPFLPKTARGPS